MGSVLNIKGNVRLKNGMDTTPKGSTPVPDPTDLTTKQLLLSIAALKELLETRLDGMDTATDLNRQATDKIPGMIKSSVETLKELHSEKFSSIATQFKERDIRAEREARDNKVAVDAAFAAQKEAAAKQDEANAKAIEKSERATAETIKTNQELSLSKIDSLTNQMNDLKISVTTITSSKQGAGETKQQSNFVAGLVITVILALLGNAITLIFLFTHVGK